MLLVDSRRDPPRARPTGKRGRRTTKGEQYGDRPRPNNREWRPVLFP